MFLGEKNPTTQICISFVVIYRSEEALRSDIPGRTAVGQLLGTHSGSQVVD